MLLYVLRSKNDERKPANKTEANSKETAGPSVLGEVRGCS